MGYGKCCIPEWDESTDYAEVQKYIFFHQVERAIFGEAYIFHAITLAISTSLLLISCPAAPLTGEGASGNYCIYVFLVLTPRNASVVLIYYNSPSQEKETAYSITREETAYSITLGMWAKYT